MRAVREDYKVGLSLEPVGSSRVTDPSDRVRQLLEENGGRIAIGDESPPEAIRETFGARKKAFKQAGGNLYKNASLSSHPTASPCSRNDNSVAPFAPLSKVSTHGTPDEIPRTRHPRHFAFSLLGCAPQRENAEVQG